MDDDLPVKPTHIEEIRSLVDVVAKQLGVSGPSDEVVAKTIDEISVAVVVVDDKSKIYLVNKFAELLFGYDRKELWGQNVMILVPDDRQLKHVGLSAAFLADPKIVMHQRVMGSGAELFGQRKDGKMFPITVDISPIATSLGMFVVSTVKLKTNDGI